VAPPGAGPLAEPGLPGTGLKHYLMGVVLAGLFYTTPAGPLDTVHPITVYPADHLIGIRGQFIL